MDPALGIALLWLAFTATHVGMSSLRRAPAAGRGARRDRLPRALLGRRARDLRPADAALLHEQARGRDALVAAARAAPDLDRLRRRWRSRSSCSCRASCARAPAASCPGDTTPRGVYRITRHPMVMAFVVFALVHLLPNGSTRRRRVLRRLRALRADRRRAPGPAQARDRPARLPRLLRAHAVPPLHRPRDRCGACASSRRSPSSPASCSPPPSATSTPSGSAAIRSRRGSALGPRAGGRRVGRVLPGTREEAAAPGPSAA